jgi:hypothetical protein
MNEMSPFPNDAENLGRRRGLAAARKTRESERTLLLQKIARTSRQATELRGWIAQWGAIEGMSPEIERMVDWARARLSVMDNFLNPSTLARELHTRNLFPEVDDLVDPLGEPPPRRPLGR